MASLSLVLLPCTPLSCRLIGPLRSWLMEAERLSGMAAAKDTEARERARPVSIRERLEKEGWRFMEKLLIDMLEAMMTGGCKRHADGN